MDFLADFFDNAPPPFNLLLDSGSQTYWPTYLGAVVVAALVYMKKRSGKPTRLKAMARYIFPRKIFLHPSSFLDIKLFFISSVQIIFQNSLFLSAGYILSGYVSDFIAFALGIPTLHLTSGVFDKIFLALILFLTYEFSYWLGHYCLHKVPWLWEFHKVHHSAEIMTPITEMRTHPVESFSDTVIATILFSIVNGIIFWLYGSDATIYTYFSTGAFIILFHITFGHLRHSHVNITTSGMWSYIFQSPLHHQIHHSLNPKHFDTNLGYSLAIWDWLFGTLCIPVKGERIKFGLDDDLQTDYSLKNHLLKPFKQSWMVLTKQKKPFAKTTDMR